MMSAPVAASPSETKPAPAPLSAIEAEIVAKRAADVVRFRTCCADPRASK